MKINYRELEEYLQRNDYASSDISQLSDAIKEMDPDSQAWVAEWLQNGLLPEIEIEGITADFLIHQCGYQPLNAFITLDWLKKDPQEAKYFILKIPSSISPSDQIGEEMAKYVADKM